MQNSLILGYFLVALVAANLPWLSERLFLVIKLPKEKPVWYRLLEWMILYFVVGAIGLALEKQATGEIYPQDWEFYAVTASLFLVFAFPGFIYRYDLRRLLRSR